jgi:hypothetical protein
MKKKFTKILQHLNRKSDLLNFLTLKIPFLNKKKKYRF